ncbi:MAG: GAF domain-containing protein, partial [Anaerolineales bacterium]|nr:GAF domain-containing protein [Anaerolineales bacterium]
MTSANIFTFLPLIAASLYTLLLVVSFVRRSQDEQQTRWFLLFLIASIVWEFLLFFETDLALPPNFPLKALLGGTLFLGMTTAVYVDWPKQKQWFLVGFAAILLAITADIFLPNQVLPIPIANATPTYHGVVSFLVWFLLTSFVFFKTWRDYRTTQFPWHANRLLFWAIGLFITFIGEAFHFFLWTGLTLTGQIIRFIGVLALAYAVTSYRIFDVRTRFQRGTAVFIITIISALPMLGAIWIVEQIGAVQNWETGSIILVTLLVIAIGFFLYQPFHKVVQRIINRYFIGEGFDTNQVLRNYSQATSRILDVNQLSLVILGTISELLETNHGTLLLITKEEEGWNVEVLPGIGQVPREAAFFNANSLFINALTQQHQPLLQYDLDFNRHYANLTDEERHWLKTMAMDVYVPITGGDDLEGLIAIGPKQSGIPYQPDELNLVQTLADQAVIALQNARLYSELEMQNEQINRLNIDLVDQNERLEIMDQVKSDFITIASHELRTPLTQVKGYADILAAMNDENILSQEQTREIVGHINRATTQLEGLISAMLDASQLDVDGMQLTFMESSVDT